MNRLILLGNGFDLAHGMPTRYNDFLLWYLKKAYKQAETEGIYEDNILKIENPQRHVLKHFEIDGVEALIDHLCARREIEMLLHQSEIKWHQYQSNTNPFSTTIKYYFFSHLIGEYSLNKWVDVENEFYDKLKYILYREAEYVTVINDDYVGAVNNALAEHNECLSHIIGVLHEYLNTLPMPDYLPKYSEILKAPIQRNEVVASNLSLDTEPENTLILNFNYTSTIGNYSKPNSEKFIDDEITVNHIHGQLNNPKNPLIFGFGDELDSDYQKMELENINGFFEYIKSFWYFKTSNYHNLVRFIDSDDFQVYILGHSCGLSDRTMLNMIFEHSQCKSIKIFYHGTEEKNNYTALTHEISRHFKNKGEMRKKIVPFDKSIAMPQVNLM